MDWEIERGTQRWTNVGTYIEHGIGGSKANSHPPDYTYQLDSVGWSYTYIPKLQRDWINHFELHLIMSALISMVGLNVIHINTGHNECNEHEIFNLFAVK